MKQIAAIVEMKGQTRPTVEVNICMNKNLYC